MKFSKIDNYLFQRARDIALTSQYTDYTRVGCIIAEKRQIISMAVNTAKTHPLQARYNNYRGFDGMQHYSPLHAEISALVKMPYNYKVNDNTAIYIMRVNKDDVSCDSYPCCACIEAIRQSGIRNVFYLKDGTFSYSWIQSF